MNGHRKLINLRIPKKYNKLKDFRDEEMISHGEKIISQSTEWIDFGREIKFETISSAAQRFSDHVSVASFLFFDRRRKELNPK